MEEGRELKWKKTKEIIVGGNESTEQEVKKKEEKPQPTALKTDPKQEIVKP